MNLKMKLAIKDGLTPVSVKFKDAEGNLVDIPVEDCVYADVPQQLAPPATEGESPAAGQ